MHIGKRAQVGAARRFGAAAALLLWAAGAPGLRADDWPQWRGAKRDSVWAETGVLESFPAGGLVVRWRVPVGYGYSSPVVAQGRVFLTDAQPDPPRSEERVLCFEEATGKLLWSFAYDPGYPDWAFTPGNEGRPTATPIVDAGRIYALGRNGHLHCLDAAGGTVLWKKSLGEEYQVPEFVCQASPLIEGSRLVVFAGGKPEACVIAFDKQTGEQAWKALDEPVTNSSPIVVEAAGTRQLIVWTEKSVTSFDCAAGEMNWRHPFAVARASAISTPVFAGNRLLVGGLMLALGPGRSDVSVLWQPKGGPSQRILSNTSTALLQGDYVFSARTSGELVCLEAATGRPVWETGKVTDLINGASIHITPNGDGAFLYTDRGELIRARLASGGYEEVSRFQLIEPTYPFAGRKVAWPPPAYANRHIFARSDKELVCASLAAGGE